MSMTQLERIIRESGLEPRACVLRHLTRTSRAVVANFDAALSPSGLTGNQFNVLMALAHRGPLKVNDLAAAIGMHPSTTPRLLAPLKRRRFVGTRTGRDRRERLIAITSSGTRALIVAYPSWARVQQHILKRLSDDGWSEAMEVLRSIRESLPESATK